VNLPFSYDHQRGIEGGNSQSAHHCCACRSGIQHKVEPRKRIARGAKRRRWGRSAGDGRVTPWAQQPLLRGPLGWRPFWHVHPVT
jgi:hypothetical protein